ncbi:MAG: cation diffusion facilitator family transporter [Alsobacter sp.]
MAALVGNILVAATKFAAAWWTGSSAMLSEAVHSTVDTLNEVLLLYGMRRARKEPNERHPLGYGREIYFWSFVVAVLVFALGAGISIYEGVQHVLEPQETTDVVVAYAVFGLSLLFEGASLAVAVRNFRRDNPRGGLLSAVRRSKDPSGFTVLLEDGAAVIGILIALGFTALQQETGIGSLDGWASILIGFVLAATAMLLARETKALLIGEAASPSMVARIREALARFPALDRDAMLTIHIGPDEIVVATPLTSQAAMSARQLEATLQDVERAARAAVPEVRSVYLMPRPSGPQAPASPAAARERGA